MPQDLHLYDTYRFGPRYVSRDGMEWHPADSDEGRALDAECAAGTRARVTDVDHERGIVTIDIGGDE